MIFSDNRYILLKLLFINGFEIDRDYIYIYREYSNSGKRAFTRPDE